MPPVEFESKRLQFIYHWVARDIIIFLKSKTKEPPKLLSSSGIMGGKFISVNSF